MTLCPLDEIVVTVYIYFTVCVSLKKNTMRSFNCNCTQLQYLFQKENIFVHHDVFIGVDKHVCTILIKLSHYDFLLKHAVSV